ncbi:hypothetical protein [Crateriforma spongiae]|uniref:hypothetical protein n=1 Tax=Crateriforma spongiae TaxID=2724528 RepID=UPI0014484A35|nr:hypothetical protein [Crateriforma spongiae]
MSAAPIPWKHIRNVLVLFSPLWGGAAVLFGLFGLSYSLFSSDVWSAKQPLVIRDEATGSVDRLGRFASQNELKAAQETILEMAKNPEVVAAALRQIGPDKRSGADDWPSVKTIETVADQCVNLVAPQGSEFGSSEVIYLSVKAKKPDRAVAFCNALFDNLTEQLRKVRRVRADSIIVELTHARDLARQNLDEALTMIQEIEVKSGIDLGELRNLNDTISGDGTSRRTLETTTSDRQAAELALSKLEAFHQLLVDGASDPQKLLISGDELMSSQPSLQRLKEGLIDAQLETSKLAGNHTVLNPKRRVAMAVEEEIKRRLQQEAAAVVRGMQPELKLARDRVNRLRQQEADLTKKLAHLAEIRATYAKLDAQLKNRTEQFAAAEAALAEARASRSAALSTNLIAELGPPQVGDSPISMSGTMLTAGSTTAGLMFGLGIVFLIAPGPSGKTYGRRWSDYLGGRRASDHASGSEGGSGQSFPNDRRAKPRT